jgi:hypothetical protein
MRLSFLLDAWQCSQFIKSRHFLILNGVLFRFFLYKRWKYDALIHTFKPLYLDTLVNDDRKDTGRL